jgi:hypothetical protein
MLQQILWLRMQPEISAAFYAPESLSQHLIRTICRSTHHAAQRLASCCCSCTNKRKQASRAAHMLRRAWHMRAWHIPQSQTPVTPWALPCRRYCVLLHAAPHLFNACLALTHAYNCIRTQCCATPNTCEPGICSTAAAREPGSHPRPPTPTCTQPHTPHTCYLTYAPAACVPGTCCSLIHTHFICMHKHNHRYVHAVLLLTCRIRAWHLSQASQRILGTSSPPMCT